MWLDWGGAVAPESLDFGPALRLFGLTRFRDGQLPIVQAALAGESILVVSPTGFGKTLCFQLPAMMRRGTSVVVSPLKALMGEQVSSLLRRKIPSSFINSDLDAEEKKLRYRFLAKNQLKMLYAAPERFFVRSERERHLLSSIRPAFLVVDEAHCVDQWGRDFRPEYGRLKEVREALGAPPVLAFTATAGREMQQRILRSLGIPNARVFVRGVDRPNIAHLRWSANAARRPYVIAQLCRVLIPGQGKVMIFVPTRKIGEALQTQLHMQGLPTPFYHSKLGTGWDREQLLKRFTGESQPIVDRIICTSAFGMGLDIPNVRLVIHWQHPSSIEDYLQEFGRAGRDGNASVAVLLHDKSGSSRDLDLLKFMAKRAVEGAALDSASASAALRHKSEQIDRMARLIENDRCLRKAFVDYFVDTSQSQRRSLSARILEFIFSDSKGRQKSVACCDFCHKKQINRYGPIAFVRRSLVIDDR